MPRYEFNQDYTSSYGAGRKGDVVEMPEGMADDIERDSPGTLKQRAGKDSGGELQPEDVLSSESMAVLDELREQTPTLDIDPEDKAMEIPGEGNKFTPASGYNPNPEPTMRVVERASTRQQLAGKKRTAEDDAGATSADTSASARVTAEPTPASAAADAAQLAGGVTAHEDDADADAKKAKKG